MNNDKKYWYIGIGVVVLLIIIFAVVKYSGKNGGLGSMGQNSSGPTLDQMAGQGATTTPAPSPTTTKLGYGAAINAYKFRFQFSGCHASPGMISVQKNTPVMLDNRDKVAH